MFDGRRTSFKALIARLERVKNADYPAQHSDFSALERAALRLRVGRFSQQRPTLNVGVVLPLDQPFDLWLVGDSDL